MTDAAPPTAPDTQPDPSRDEKTSCMAAPVPSVSIPIDTAGTTFNAVIRALRGGAFNDLPLAQLHGLTGHMLLMENILRPHVQP